MTLPLRRKRLITVHKTTQATASEPRAGFRGLGASLRLTVVPAALALCLGVAGIFSTASAGEAAAPASAPLKWHARGVRPQTLAETQPDVAEPSVPQFRAKRSAAERHANLTSPVSTRSQMRDVVMQVSGEEDPLSDPFGDKAHAKKEEPASPKEPALLGAEEPAEDKPADKKSSESSPLDNDPFPNEPLPVPPSDDNLPPGDWSKGIESSGGSPGCKGYQDECVRAVTQLQNRDITKIVVGVVIEGVEGEDFPCDCKLGKEIEAPTFAGRHFSPTIYTWKAAGTCHKPLYFEDVHLERYGHSWNPVVQPFMSAAHFFVSVPLLPYKMGLTPPNECIYTLGYYRPGSCAPYMIDPIPFSLRATVYEAFGAAAFGFWFFPPG